MSPVQSIVLAMLLIESFYVVIQWLRLRSLRSAIKLSNELATFANSTIVSYDILSPEGAEDAFFNSKDRMVLYFNTKDGITSFFVDEKLTQRPLSGYYCDGFFFIIIKDDSVEFKALE